MKSAELKRYKRTEMVSAGEILSVEKIELPIDTDGDSEVDETEVAFKITLADSTMEVIVSEKWAAKNKPEAGKYYIKNSDGVEVTRTESFFRENYTQLPS